MPTDEPFSWRDRVTRARNDRLARWTRRLRRVPGTRHLIEPLRKKTRGYDTVTIDDFDRDLKLELDVGTPLGSWIYWHGYHELDVLMAMERRLRADSVVIDVGANLGEVTLFVAKRVPRGRVVALEPSPDVFARLVKNIDHNGFTHVQAFAIGAGEHEDWAELFDPAPMASSTQRSDGALASLIATPGAIALARVHVRPLDDLLEELNLPRVDLIKLDVEGSELSVLRGARRTLEAHHPDVIVEMSDSLARRAGYELSEIFGLMRSLGYSAFEIGHGRALEAFRHGWRSRHGQLVPLRESAVVGFSNVLFTKERAPTR